MEWIKEFDEGIGREIEGDIQAAHNEYCISRDNCDCDTRYERLKTAITTQITKARNEAFEEAAHRLVDLDAPEWVGDELYRLKTTI